MIVNVSMYEVVGIAVLLLLFCKQVIKHSEPKI